MLIVVTDYLSKHFDRMRSKPSWDFWPTMLFQLCEHLQSDPLYKTVSRKCRVWQVLFGKLNQCDEYPFHMFLKKQTFMQCSYRFKILIAIKNYDRIILPRAQLQMSKMARCQMSKFLTKHVNSVQDLYAFLKREYLINSSSGFFYSRVLKLLIVAPHCIICVDLGSHQGQEAATR